MASEGVQNLQRAHTHTLREFCTAAGSMWSPLAPEPLFLIHLDTDEDLKTERYNKDHGTGLLCEFLGTWHSPTWSCSQLFYASYVDTQE